VSRRLAATALGYNRRQRNLLVADATAHDLTADIGGVAAPVLVATGRFDANVSPRTAWRIHRAMPRSRFHVWERSGHYPMVEEPEAFFRTVDRFLREASQRPQPDGALKLPSAPVIMAKWLARSQTVSVCRAWWARALAA
jgi:hypothetical protein